MTAQALPIACSLTASQLRRRLDDIAQLVRDSLIDRRPLAGGARLTFRGGPDVRARLDALVAAEGACCPFLALQLTSDGDSHVLKVTGPPEAEPVIDELFRP